MKPFLFIIGAVFLLIAPSGAQRQVPHLIHFQGRLTREQQAFNGAGEFKFSLVNSNGSVTFWSNDGTGERGNEPSNAVAVPVYKGMFSVTLGDTAQPNMTPVSPLVFANADVRLRIWFREERHGPRNGVGQAHRDRGDAGKWDDERKGKRDFELLTPDQRITSVGYAMFAANVPDGAITSAKLATGAVTRDKLAPDAIPPTRIEDGSVATRHLADSAVNTSKLADGAVTTTKLATGAVATAHLANSAVTQDKLAPGSVGTGQLIDNAVRSNHLAAGAVLANLTASGQSGVTAGGIILSMDENSSALTSAGYTRSGSLSVTPERWENWTGPASLNFYYVNVAVWTGAELIAAYTARDFQGARYDRHSDSWRRINGTGAPSFREQPAFLWTGSEMIVWGGYNGISGSPFQDGFLYNPTTDRWRPMTTSGAPQSRVFATVLWTGSEMLVWGGGGLTGGIVLNTGGRFDPIRNQWQPISTSGSPTARYNHTAVWTGEEMIVWGGQVGDIPRTVLNSGGRYRPSNDTWTILPVTNAPPAASEHTAVWTGTEMIVWGGKTSTPDGTGDLRTGGRFSPIDDSWQALPTLNAPLRRSAHQALWTGREMIIWGGRLSEPTTAGGRYIPTSNEWFPLTTQTAPVNRTDHKIFWLGDGMLVIGGRELPSSNVNDSIMPLWRPGATAYLYQFQRR